jgi:LysR family transcriptional regulator of beta-lactamase
MTNSDSRMPSNAALRAFEASARHLSFTRAALELNQTQGAVSLFRRGARGISLTRGGRTYLPAVC